MIFVEALADRYKIQFVCRREKLGADASEELARQRRYEFLRGVATDFDGVIVTAHHRDDIIETVAMNLKRGSRWRGLANAEFRWTRAACKAASLSVITSCGTSLNQAGGYL